MSDSEADDSEADSEAEPAKRFPGHVYGVGSEPDPRFSLANERTFLAWIRTTLALLAGAAAVDALDLPMSDRAQQTIALALALAGLLSAVQAWRGWAATERAMRLDAPMPRNRTLMPLVALLVIVAVAFIVASVTS
ncbi:MAG: YidH family protein [Dermatophilaceae bacterium]